MKRLLLLACALAATQSAFAADWQKVGWFRSDSRNVSISDTLVRVVSIVDTQRLNIKGRDFVEDSLLIQRFYPGWDYQSDMVVFYGPTPSGFSQSRVEYKTGTERTPLKGDTVSASLGIYDRTGHRTVKVTGTLAKQLGDTARVVAARSFNWDDDEEKEWVVITAGPEDVKSKARSQSVRFYNRAGESWKCEQQFELRDPVFTGPLELRDVTKDGKPDVVYRTFLETPGHFWIDAHVFSRQEGLGATTVPFVFQPENATGPVGP